MDKKHSKAPLFIGLSIVLLLMVIVGGIMFSKSKTAENRFQTQLDLGYKYLEELDYEMAIASFNAAIEIDPRNIEGYNGLIDVYSHLSDAEGFLIVYNLMGENLSPEDSEKIMVDIISELKEMIDNAISDGDYDRAEELIDILKQIDSSEADSYLLSDATEEAEEDAIAEDIDSVPYIIKSERSDGLAFTYEYYDDGKSFCVSGSDGSWTIYEYDDFGREIRQESNSGYWKEKQYDSEGRIIREESGGFIVNDMNRTLVECYTYDDSGMLVSFTTSSGEVARFESDDRGNLTYFEYQDGDTLVWTSYKYDSDNHVIYSTNSFDNTFEYTYDENGILRTSTNMIMYTYYYDTLGNPVCVETPEGSIFYTNTYSDGSVRTYENQ